ncbi:MAG: hypothetical protein AB7Q17_14285 [Phycisphaerae bacterium]
MGTSGACRTWRVALTATLVWGFAGGCGFPDAGFPGSPAASPRDCVRIVMVRGLWDIFSTGLDDLNVKLIAAGYDSDAISGPDWRNAAEKLARQYGAEGATETLILGGHSYGADEAIQAAKVLRGAGVDVPLLVLIDATNPGRIPPNVVRCVHFYLPNVLGQEFPSAFSGNPVEPEEGNTRTIIENLPLTPENFGDQVATVDHFNIESNALLHELIIARVEELCPRDTAP